MSPLNRTAFVLLLALAAIEPAARPVEAQSITIERAIRTALDRNRDLRAARHQLGAADRLVSEAWSSVFPTVELNANYTRNISPAVSFLPARIFDPDAGPDDLVPLRFGADNSWNSNIRFEQPLFEAKAFIGVGASGRYRTLQNEMVRGVSHSVVTRVRLSYYTVLLAREQERALRNSVDRVRASLDEARAMQSAGFMSEYDVLRLEVELSNLEPNLRRAENAVAQRQRDLAIELGADSLANGAVVGVLSELDIENPDANTPENRSLLLAGVEAARIQNADELISTALVRRSDIRQLELTETLRRTEVRVEQMEYLPRVSLFGNYIIAAQQNGRLDFFGRGANERAYSRLAGISVTVPIFAGLRENARIGGKREALRQAESQTELARDRAAAELHTLVAELEESALRARAQKRAVAQAQRGFEIASAQFREGIGSRLEQTDAEVALRQSEFNYAQAIFDYLSARARLDEAVGVVPMVDVAG